MDSCLLVAAAAQSSDNSSGDGAAAEDRKSLNASKLILMRALGLFAQKRVLDGNIGHFSREQFLSYIIERLNYRSTPNIE